MIKPGTLCMIRGVPQNLPGHEFNGHIVTAQGLKVPEDQVYWIEPALVSGGRQFTGCREQWLFPFKDFDPQELTVTDQELETA